MKPDHSLPRVHRALALKPVPQAVLRHHGGRFELIDAGSPRHLALTRCSEWSARIAGVFSPSVSWPVFVREVAA